MTIRKVETFYTPAAYPQALACSWCRRGATDLETDIDGVFVCQDELSCQQVFDVRNAGRPVVVSEVDRRRLAYVLAADEGMVAVAQGLPWSAEG